MKIAFSPVDEDGRKSEAMDSAPTELTPAQVAVTARREANLDRLQSIIEASFMGLLARDRELKPWEPVKLLPKHVQMVFDRVAGVTVQDIAAKYGIGEDWASIVLNHPDAKYLMTTICSMGADRLTDVNERLVHLAPEALNVKVDLMRHSRQDTVRDKAASDILALAGYGKKVQEAPAVGGTTINGPVLILPAQAAAGLSETLKEAHRVSSTSYQQFLIGARGDEVVVAESKQLDGNLQGKPGKLASVGGASPTPSPEHQLKPIDPEVDDIEVDIATRFGLVGKEADELRFALQDEKEETRRTA